MSLIKIISSVRHRSILFNALSLLPVSYLSINTCKLIVVICLKCSACTCIVYAYVHIYIYAYLYRICTSTYNYVYVHV